MNEEPIIFICHAACIFGIMMVVEIAQNQEANFVWPASSPYDSYSDFRLLFVEICCLSHGCRSQENTFQLFDLRHLTLSSIKRHSENIKHRWHFQPLEVGHDAFMTKYIEDHRKCSIYFNLREDVIIIISDVCLAIKNRGNLVGHDVSGRSRR